MVCLGWMGVKGGPPASEAHWSLQRPSNPGDHTLSSSRNNETKVSLWILEHVSKLIFVSEAIAVRVSTLLWDGGKSEINFLGYCFWSKEEQRVFKISGLFLNSSTASSVSSALCCYAN